MEVDLLRIARTCQLAQFWETPYDVGTLARSMTDLMSVGENIVEYLPFTVGYGKILNDLPIIHYRIRNPMTGIMYEGSYVNKHYRWLSNFTEHYANDIPINFPGIRRI